MKNFFIKLKVLGELIITFSGIYAALMFTFSSVLVNILLIIVSLFIFSQALGSIDELNGYNQHHSGNPDNNNKSNPSGFPDINQTNTGNQVSDFPDTDFPDSLSPDTNDLNQDYSD